MLQGLIDIIKDAFFVSYYKPTENERQFSNIIVDLWTTVLLNETYCGEVGYCGEQGNDFVMFNHNGQRVYFNFEGSKLASIKREKDGDFQMIYDPWLSTDTKYKLAMYHKIIAEYANLGESL